MGKKAYKWKEYTLPSGKIIKIQGYKHFALELLLQIYNENDIITDKKDIPKIWYTSCGIKKLYYPDFYIPNNNLLIEVKSEYIFNKHIITNLEKN